MIVLLDDKDFFKDLTNFSKYSEGFLEGIEKGKPSFLAKLANSTIKTLKEFIDSNARVNPATLQHIYEWYRTGSPASRLFDIEASVSNSEIKFFTNFKQSTSIQNGSTTPFYDKARIMEEGTPVTIKPVKAKVLSFDIGTEHIFTDGPIVVDNPGGTQAQHGLENVVNLFFNNFFSQSFLKSSGIIDHLENPIAFNRGLSMGKQNGKTAGIEVGYNWINKETVI